MPLCKMTRVQISLALLGAVSIGCGDAGRVEPPEINPTVAGKAAIREYDSDGDQRISREESRQCPGIADEAFGRYDANGDGHVTAQEITDRLQGMLDKNIGLVPAWCMVYLDGQPLRGAVVLLQPEIFLEGMIGEARGVTNARGMAHLNAAEQEGDDPLPGVPPGIYRVQITHPEIDLPPRYNSSTTLGMEVAPMERGADNKEFRLDRG